MKRRALEWTAAVTLLAVLTVTIFFPLFAHLVHGGAPRWLEGDVAEEYWPDLVVLCRGLAHHHIPRWLPFEHGGTPFYADPQAGVYYPLNHAMCALAGPSPSIHWADARVVLHFFAAAVCMTLFLSHEGVKLPAATFGGALFEMSPYFRHNWELNLTWGFAWFPLVLLAASAICRKPTPLRGALLALALALVVSVGSPPSSFFALLGASFFVAYGVVVSIRAGTSPQKLAIAAFAALATAACVLPVMLLPTWELTKYSVQTAHDFATNSEGGAPLRDVLGVVLPSLTDHHYVGVLALALAPLAFIHPRAFAHRWFFLGLAVFALLMMAGTHTPFFRLAYALIPGVSLFRDPTRYSSLYGASMAVLAAAGLSALVSGELSTRALRRWAAASMAAALVLIALSFTSHGEGLVRAGVLFAVSIIASFALQRLPSSSKVWVLAIALGGIACADLFPWLVEERHTRAWPVAEGRETEASLRAIAPDLAHFRTYDEFGVGMRSGSRYEQRDMRGYQDPLSIGRYGKMLGLLETKPALLGTFNVRWVLYAPHYAFGDWHHFIPDPALGTWAVLRAPHVWELEGALPDAFWMDGAAVVQDKDEALDRLAASAPTPEIVFEKGDAPEVSLSNGEFVPAEAHVEDESVSISVDAPRAGWLLVNETYYPGWVATVDGAPAAILRANAFVRAVSVGPGKHHIAMDFRPWQPKLLEPLALAALVLVAAGAVISRRRRSA